MQASTTIMEEELESTLTKSDENNYGRVTNSLQNGYHKGSTNGGPYERQHVFKLFRHAQQNDKDDISYAANYTNGSIITQIEDQDGFRATRIPISHHTNPSGNYVQTFTKISNSNNENYTNYNNLNKQFRNCSLETFTGSYGNKMANGLEEKDENKKSFGSVNNNVGSPDSNTNTMMPSNNWNQNGGDIDILMDPPVGYSSKNGYAGSNGDVINKNLVENDLQIDALKSGGNSVAGIVSNSSFGRHEAKYSLSRNGRDEISTEL